MGFAFGIGRVALLIILAIVGAIITGIFYITLKTVGAVIIGVILLSLLAIAILLVQGIFSVFTNAIWVLFFNEVAGQKIASNDKKIKVEDLAENTA